MLSGWKCLKVILTLLSDKMNFWLPGQPKLPRNPKLGERLEVYCALENTTKRYAVSGGTYNWPVLGYPFWSAEAKCSAK